MSGAASDTTRALKSRRVEYVRRLDDAVADLVRRLSSMEEVRRVSVFGSYARGRRDLFSDLDVLVIMETDLTYVERLRHLYGLVAQRVSRSPLLYSPGV